jgi:NAD(P)-dependent dehydrogenase (short-subunit alcohol dehydrogenase family)
MTVLPDNKAPRTWLITGASKGLGRAFSRAALAAGDRVVGASRDPEPLADLAADFPDDLLPLAVDVTDRAAVMTMVERAIDRYDRLDVVVNNAGTITMGMVEELSEEQARAQMETNFFGALWVNQAVMPQLRSQRSGHIVQISSIAALGGFPSTGLYSASKFALEGMSEALAMEAAAFGIKLTIVQPGGYWTDLYRSGLTMTEPSAAYAPLRAELETQWAEGSSDSDPGLAAEAVIALINSDDPPLRLVLGGTAYDLAVAMSGARLRTWAGWEDVSRAAEQPIPGPGEVAPS